MCITKLQIVPLIAIDAHDDEYGKEVRLTSQCKSSHLVAMCITKQVIVPVVGIDAHNDEYGRKVRLTIQ